MPEPKAVEVLPPDTPSEKTKHHAPQLAKYQFKKGISGNPSGRPKKTKITDALRQILEEECSKDPKSRTFARLLAERLVKEGVRKSGKARDAIAAIAEIADRTEGKPAQRVTFGEGGEGININIRRVE